MTLPFLLLWSLGDMPWDNHFPVFYSLIVGLCLKIGDLFLDYNAGVALYSFLQLGSMALILGRMLEWMRSKGVHKILVYFGLAYFGAVPFFGNYAIVMWKDPWFCGVMLLLECFYMRKEIKKVAAVSVLYRCSHIFCDRTGLYAVFSAENLFVESVGIPLQQMARVVEAKRKDRGGGRRIPG